MIVAGGVRLYCLSGKDGTEEWRYQAGSLIVSSPAVGDADGDGAPEVVFGAGQDLVCLNALAGHFKWRYGTSGHVYSSPALGSRSRSEPFRRDWPMFRHDPQRTGFYGYQLGPLGVYVGSDDGNLHLVDGRTGRRIDCFAVQFPDLVIQSGNHGSLKFLSSPSLADLDGNGTLEAVFTLVDRVWAVEDLGSTRATRAEPASQTGRRETAKKNTAPVRNSFALAQVAHTGGWNPTIPVPAKLLEELTKRAKLDVVPEMVPVSLRDDDVTRFPFLYITGHEEVKLTDEEVGKLKGHLERGGFLLAEACCNAEPFHRSVRAIAVRIFGENGIAKLAADHPLFSKVYPMQSVRIGGVAAAPEFEGAAARGRLAFLLTRQDYACSWGGASCSSGCRGVAGEDSYRMMTNIVVTALTE
ncbi:MAG: DUF4159 domain-containing protein [Planctomycetes bacterium]|nr:DUF4159 domain-containing protein [Planctomycetota bacterium]